MFGWQTVHRPVLADEFEDTVTEKWEQVRQKRNNLLSQSDWTVLIDSPLTDEKKQEYITYRQDLRDLPSKYNNPDDVIFPNPPEL